LDEDILRKIEEEKKRAKLQAEVDVQKPSLL
jgi:hypothetical protein